MVRDDAHYRGKPRWLTRKIPAGASYREFCGLLDGSGVSTVCREARCPNAGECYSRGTATFMILGTVCTRACRFCAVSGGTPSPVDDTEPQKVARAAVEMGLSYAVITSVTRDDLADGGAGQFAATLIALREAVPGIATEVLIPDFLGSKGSLDLVLGASPDVLNHNIETVPRLYREVRPGADYQRSLDIFRHALETSAIPLKSGMMLGLGETNDEIDAVLADLFAAGVTRLTLGQYLQPTPEHIPVADYISPDQFDKWREKALALGFLAVASGPLVRSSYMAESLALHSCQ